MPQIIKMESRLLLKCKDRRHENPCLLSFFQALIGMKRHLDSFTQNMSERTIQNSDNAAAQGYEGKQTIEKKRRSFAWQRGKTAAKPAGTLKNLTKESSGRKRRTGEGIGLSPVECPS